MDLFVLYFFLQCFLTVFGEEGCPLPNESTLVTLLKTSLDDFGIEVSEIEQETFTCLAAAETLNKYRSLSVVVQYKENSTEAVEYTQFQANCELQGTPEVLVWVALSGEYKNVDQTYMNLTTREDCYVCRSGFPLSDDMRNCLFCDSSCGGSGKCIGEDDDDCCPVYVDQMCANSCPENFAPNKADNYQCSSCNFTCPEGFEPFPTCNGCNLTDICLAEQPCQNGGVCALVSPAVSNYYCNCTANFNGTNCTVCTLACDPGYSLTQDCTCTISDICVADNPCKNGALCFQLEPFDTSDYMCNCTSVFTGENCTECIRECDPGYAVTEDCTCSVSNICQLDDPCQNGGTCILNSSPHHYHCLCANLYEPSSNCSDCSLNCSNGFTSDESCTKCVLSNICVAESPCQNGGSCSLVSGTEQYICDCKNTNFTGKNCSNCDLKCGRGYSVDAETCECELWSICEANSPCQNGGNCSLLGGAPYQYHCECVNKYKGINCTVITETSTERISSLWWWTSLPTAFLILFIAGVSMVAMLKCASIHNRKKRLIDSKCNIQLSSKVSVL